MPPTDDTVLLTLPAGGDLKAPRPRKEGEAPSAPDLKQATAKAWEYIARSRAEGDPRWIGFAQGEVMTWWHEAHPPKELLLLRATIRQSSHEFDPALADLNVLLAEDPYNAQALLTKMTILQVKGEYAHARSLGLAVFHAAPKLAAITAAASVASLNGDAEASYQLLQNGLAEKGSPDLLQLVWAETVAAEIAARLGKPPEADHQYQLALGHSRRDAYLLNSYAGFLLDESRPADVLQFLNDPALAANDDLEVRRVTARKAINPADPGLAEAIENLRARFDADQHRTVGRHLRTEGRFTLDLLGDARAALALAKTDWETQREPADLRLLLECALAARDDVTARAAADWALQAKLEDVHVAPLLKRVANLGKTSAP